MLSPSRISIGQHDCTVLIFRLPATAPQPDEAKVGIDSNHNQVKSIALSVPNTTISGREANVPTSPKEAKRSKVIEEINTTEKAYIRDLKVIDEVR